MIDAVRLEVPDDHEAVRDLHRRAFGDEGADVVRLVDALRATFGPDRALSLVAEEAGAVVGHVMFTPSLLDAPRRLVDVQVLSPLGVLPDWQGRGVGRRLVRRGLELLEQQGAAAVFVEGDPRYYSRSGFVQAGDLGFRKPSLRIPDAAFQVVLLPAYEPWMTGTLVYAQVFWDCDAVGLRKPEAPTS